MKIFKMTADYHTHTYHSDGHNSVRDNVIVAVEKGLTTIGITDHGFNHRLGGITHADVAELRAEITAVQKEFPQIKILLGIEANLLNLNGDIDLTAEDLKLFDYVILGIHYFTFGKGVKGSFIFNMRNLLWNTKKHRQRVTESYIKAMDNFPIKVIVHPNYATGCDVAMLANACKERGVLLEFNGKRVEYSADDVQALIDSEVGLIMGSDAHYSYNVGNVEVQREFLKNYPNFPLERFCNIKCED